MKETSKFNRVFRGEGRDLCSSYFSSSRHRLGTYWSSCGCSRAVDRFSPFHDFFLLGTKTGRDDQNGWADEQDRHRSRDARRSGRPVRPDPSRRRGRRSQRHRRARQDAQRRPPDPGTIEREWAGTGGFLKIFVVPLQHYVQRRKNPSSRRLYPLRRFHLLLNEFWRGIHCVLESASKMKVSWKKKIA